MRQHPTKFDEHPLKLARNKACGLSERAGLEGSSALKVNRGETGRGRQMDPRLVEAFHRKWEEVVRPATGFSSYEEMRESINRELKRPWM